MIYSNQVYALRKKHHISQERMARDLCISRRSISNIEKGEQNLSLEMAYRIASYFEKLVSEVFPLLSEEELIRFSQSESQQKGDFYEYRFSNNCSRL